MGTIQTVTTDEVEFASAFYEVALRDGYEVDAQVLADGTHQITFGGEDNDVAALLQAAYTLENERFEAMYAREQERLQYLRVPYELSSDPSSF